MWPSVTPKPLNCGSAKDSHYAAKEIPFKCSQTKLGNKYQMNLNNSGTSFCGSERKKRLNINIILYSLNLVSNKVPKIYKKMISIMIHCITV